MRRRFLLAALLMLTLPLQGCWNYREIESLSIVAGVAIDRGQEGHKYHLTLDIADTSGAGKDKPVKTTLLECEGDTLFDAIRTASKTYGMRQFWQNCQVVVISREVASESILPVIDFLFRDAEPRLTMEVFISEEETAKAILETKPASMAIKSFELDKIYEQNEKLKPVAAYQRLYEIRNTLASSGQQLALPSLRHVKSGESMACELCGMSLFRGDHYAGSLSQEDSGYAMYVMDRAQGGILNIKTPVGNDIAALEVFENKTTVIPMVDDGGALRFVVHTQTEVALGELDETADVTSMELMNGFEAAAEMQLKTEIERVVALVQQTGLDIFGFGEMLHRSNPGAWYQVQDNWEEVFKTLPVEVSCRINFRNSGKSDKPVKVGGRR